MRLRVWRRVRLCRGVTLNIGKRGLSSVSFGVRGAHYTVGRNGRRRTTIGLPGSGLFLTEEQRRPSSAVPHPQPWLLFVLLLLAALALLGK